MIIKISRKKRFDIIVVSILLQTVITFISYGKSQSLPWQFIIEKTIDKNKFCKKVLRAENDIRLWRTHEDANTPPKAYNNYAFQPGEPINITLPKKPEVCALAEKLTIEIEQFYQGNWQNIHKTMACIETSRNISIAGPKKEGVYRILIKLKTPSGKLCNAEKYAIVSKNWKKDILTFCQTKKEKIELRPDPKLIFSSITISHFDHTMEIVAQSGTLTWNVLKILDCAIKNKNLFDKGQCPDIVKGALNKIRLKRLAGAPIAEFNILTPSDYNTAKAWPLTIEIDSHLLVIPQKNLPILKKSVYLQWRTITKNNLNLKDYQSLRQILKDKLRIDDDRVYLRAKCANGIETMALMFHYPDKWAHCNIELGNRFRNLAGNALNLSLDYYHGASQKKLFPYYNFAVKCFDYYGCKYTNIYPAKEMNAVEDNVTLKKVRIKAPRRVLLTTDSLQKAAAYWVTILGRNDENLTATIDAVVDKQTIHIKTNNINAYSLNLVKCPADSNKPVKIIENGADLGSIQDKVAVKKAELFENAALVKNSRLHGPIQDAFTDPYVVVYGTKNETQQFLKENKKLAKSLSNGAPCYTDTELPEKMIRTHNLILVGNTKSNSLLSGISKNLPIRATKNGLIAHNKLYKAQNIGYVLIYPNPLNPDKYVAVFAANTSQVTSKMLDAYHQAKFLRPVDVALFELNSEGIKWHIIEKLNTFWDWHENRDEVLTVMEQKYPKWKWQQLITKAIREQLNADIAIYEDPFLFSNTAPLGPITYRCLCNTFRNDWIIKIRIKGKHLKKLLAPTFNYDYDRKINNPTIDGIQITGQQNNSNQTNLYLHQLKNDRYYTLAIRDEMLNGQRLGFALKEYSIVDDERLIPLLKQYIDSNRKPNLDSKLNNVKLNLF